MPTRSATDEWRKPASTPARNPNSPATGASVVSVIGSRAVLFLRNPQNIQYDLP